jgi:ribulose-phosphate 3-epimerase
MFVPNISFGIPGLKNVRKHAKKPLYLHFMIGRTGKIYSIKKFGVDCISVPYEACYIIFKEP